MLKGLIDIAKSGLEFLDVQYARLIGDHQYYNGPGFESVMHSINFDIRFLSRYRDTRAPNDEAFARFIARSQGPDNRPSFGYQYLTFENRFRYFEKRRQVEDLLTEAGLN